MKPFLYGSLFSGAGLLDAGLEQSGWSCQFMCEIDPVARRVLAKHRPGVECHTDVTTLDPAVLPRIAALVGGSPCQGLSVAGRREGLADDRSGLFVHLVRIADILAPRWVLWENVAGALSSQKGEDFACVLEMLSGFRPAVPKEGWKKAGLCWGPKRGLAWRVLDASRVGGCALHCDEFGIGPVPQSRRRVFLVAHSGDGAGVAGAASRQDAASRLAALPTEILLEPESCAWDFTPRRQKRPDAAATLRSRSASRGVSAPGRGGEDDENLVIEIAHTIAAGQGGSKFGSGRDGQDDEVVLAGTLNAHSKKHGHAMTTQQAAESGQIITHALTAEGADASEDGTGRGTPLVADCIPIDMRQASRGAKMTNNRAEGSSGGAPGTGVGESGDPSPALAETHVPAVAYSELGEGHQTYEETDVAIAVRTSSGGGGQMANVVAFTVHSANSCAKERHAFETERAKSLDTTGGFASGQGGTVIAAGLRQVTSGENRNNPQPGEPCPTLNGAGEMVVAFQERGREAGRTLEVRADGLANNIMAPAGGGRRHEMNIAAFGRSADAKKTGPGKVLRTLRRKVGEEAFATWWIRVLERLRETEVLRSEVHGEGVRSEAHGDKLGSGTQRGAADQRQGAVREMWAEERERRPPPEWGLARQHTKQLGAYLSLLSQQGPRQTEALLDLWEASEGLGALRNALSALQETWQSAGLQDPDTETMFGDRMQSTSKRQGVVRPTLHGSEATSPTSAEKGGTGVSAVVRRLTPV